MLDERDGIEGNVFFFAADYRDAAQLTRNLVIQHARVEPGSALEATMAQNVVGDRALQFEHWERPQDHLGQDAIFVLTRPDRRDYSLREAERHFDQVTRVERVIIKRLGFEVSHADVFICKNYRGPAKLH